MSRGRWCRICGRRRPNEEFSGRGHRDCLCKDCQQRLKSERDKIDIERELYGYVEQSNISAGNVKRLTELAEHDDARIREHAAALLDIARLYPRRRRRWKRLVKSHFNLFQRYRQAIGLWDDRDVDDVFGEELLELRPEPGWPSPDAADELGFHTEADGDYDDVPF